MPVTPAVDIYAFGVSALEVSPRRISFYFGSCSNDIFSDGCAWFSDQWWKYGEYGRYPGSHREDDSVIGRSVATGKLYFPCLNFKVYLFLFWQDFIERCLAKDPAARPTARELLFHPVLFEVHSLKLLAAHAIVTDKSK